MSHRKARSCSESGSRVPFSWEQRPGTPKFHMPSQSFSAATELSFNPFQKSASFHFINHSNGHQRDLEKGADPFAAAIEKCSKHIANQGLVSERSRNYAGSNKGRVSKSVFSCKKSCDVREDILVRRPNGVPPRPHREGRSKDHADAMAELERFLMRVGESKEMMRNSKNTREKMLKM